MCVCGEVDYNYEAINFELKNTCYIISVDYCVTHIESFFLSYFFP